MKQFAATAHNSCGDAVVREEHFPVRLSLPHGLPRLPSEQLRICWTPEHLPYQEGRSRDDPTVPCRVKFINLGGDILSPTDLPVPTERPSHYSSKFSTTTPKLRSAQRPRSAPGMSTVEGQAQPSRRQAHRHCHVDLPRGARFSQKTEGKLQMERG